MGHVQHTRECCCERISSSKVLGNYPRRFGSLCVEGDAKVDPVLHSPFFTESCKIMEQSLSCCQGPGLS